jgi:acyl-CoA reductase-like NAD-dependent aldehyde dehydrogenase
MSSQEPFLLAGGPRRSDSIITIHNPFDGRPIAEVCQAGTQDASEACAAAEDAFAETRQLPSWRREQILSHISRELALRSEEFARGIALEAGKPIRDARAEVARAVQTFRIAAEESKRIGGELLPLDWTPGTDRRAGLVRRFPVGPVLGITPFNFPVNLVAHKVAPAIASGNPVVIKPAPKTPLSALRLGNLIVEAGWPTGAISVLPCSNEVAGQLLVDPRIKKLSFTGSATVGWQLKAAVPKKRVTLELGGNAAAIVHDDADIELAARRIVQGGFAYSGQSCISVQRVFAHSRVRPALLDRLVNGLQALVTGDPLDEKTDVGPMINEDAAKRAESWIQAAAAAGGKVLIGGDRRGAMLAPALLTDVPPDTTLACEEAFAPMVFVNGYDSFEEALAKVNASRYGLQAGVFTREWPLMAKAFRSLEVGAVLIDEVPTWRADHMPYGGVKDSGFGREGIVSAIEAMTEPRLMIFSL